MLCWSSRPSGDSEDYDGHDVCVIDINSNQLATHYRSYLPPATTSIAIIVVVHGNTILIAYHITRRNYAKLNKVPIIFLVAPFLRGNKICSVQGIFRISVVNSVMNVCFRKPAFFFDNLANKIIQAGAFR